MGSTYFRKVEVVKTEFYPYLDKTFTDNVYVVFFETAESNVRNYNGGLCWHKYIWKIGTYSEVMRDICRMSYEFEDGICQWKPANKTPEGFIHTCRKAIKDAVMQDKLNCEESFINTFDDGINELLKKFGELDGVEYQTYFDNGGILRSKDIVLMYSIKKFVELCKEECKATLSTPLEYMKKYCNSNGYFAQKSPIIANLFKAA